MCIGGETHFPASSAFRVRTPDRIPVEESYPCCFFFSILAISKKKKWKYSVKTSQGGIIRA